MWVSKAVVMYYNVYYDFCKPGYIKDNLDQFLIDHLRELINNDQNGIVTVFFSIDWNW